MDLISTSEKSIWIQLKELADASEQLFIKKLSRNDTSWADDPNKHQAGFYIPREIRESGYFPPLLADNPAKPHIFRVLCASFWPQTGEIKQSSLRHYSNKGPETHFTAIPHEVFRGLHPSSLLVSGRLREPASGIAYFWFLVLDSESEESELLETALDLSSDFRFGLYEPAVINNAARFESDQLQDLIQRIDYAIRAGTLDQLISEVTKIPSPNELALQAKAEYLKLTGEPNLDPFRINAPGDAIMRISRDIEYAIFRRYELRRRAAEVVKVLAEHKRGIVDAVVRNFQSLDSIFLSASQQRKTRAGRSFEFHIASVLTDGKIRFEEQAIFGGRRPDFVLPNLRTLKRIDRTNDDAIVIAAKTTLRDRWKGLSSEATRCHVYLATVDDRVMPPVIDELAREGITLVVPESLKSSKECYYAASPTTITFREMFTERIRKPKCS